MERCHKERNMKRTDVTLEEKAYEKLKDAIVMGKYPPGYQIVEIALAAKLEMSRSPVRIAIKRLEGEGILERRSNKRYYVAHANKERTMETLYVREVLEGLAARLAASRRTELDIQKLNNCMEQMDKYSKENKSRELYLESVRFHKLIFRIARNSQLEKFGVVNMEQEAVFSYRSLFQNNDRTFQAHTEHKEILCCIIQKDCDGAEKAARNHIKVLIQRVIKGEELL